MMAPIFGHQYCPGGNPSQTWIEQWLTGRPHLSSQTAFRTAVMLFGIVGGTFIFLNFTSRMITLIFRGRLEERPCRRLLKALFRDQWEAYLSQSICHATTVM
jgi:hypothetical protein